MIKIKTFSFRQAIERMCLYTMILVVIILVIFFSILFVYFLKDELKKVVFSKKVYSDIVFSKSVFINKVLENELPSFLFTDSDEKLEQTDESGDGLINSEIVKLENSQSLSNEISANVELKGLPNIEYKIPEKFDTKVIGDNKVQVGNVVITNYSKLKLDLKKLAKPVDIKVDANTDFLIFHTHATESYTIDSEDVVNYRSTNENFNMLSIGSALIKELETRGFKCLHDKILHDYPSYNGAYKHSLDAVSKYLDSKDFEFVFDLHRDAISSDLSYAMTSEIENEKAAMLMFVIGTDASGLNHDDWMENLRMAITIQNRANQMYPGLFRDINLSSSRYNQHVSNGACIIEVGTTGNTLDEAKTSMKFLANVMESFK